MKSEGVNELLKRIRKRGEVPLAVIAYDVENDIISSYIFADQRLVEVNAILDKLGLKVTPVDT